MSAEKVLRKHVAIIHAYSMMSVLQRKIVNILFLEALKSKADQEANNSSVVVECCMSFSKLAKSIHFNSNNTQYLKEAIDDLASLKIEWNLLKDRIPTNISFLNLRILHGFPTFYHDGIFNFSFHNLIFDFIGNPAIYGTIDMELQSKFESKYGHSLYENSTRFLNLQKGKSISLDTFRKLFGVDDEKYLSMREFTRNVIRPSIEEVNDRSEFVVDLENIKVGRKITGFELSVASKKKNIPINNEAVNDKHNKVQEELKRYFGNISEQVLGNILQNYSEKYLLEKIVYTKEHAKKDKLGLYPVPYLIKAIKDDYRFTGEHAPENKKELETIAQKSVWREQLSSLQADLSHWKRKLEYAKGNSNNLLVENIGKIMLNCEEKLRQHLLNKSNDQSQRENFT